MGTFICILIVGPLALALFLMVMGLGIGACLAIIAAIFEIATGSVPEPLRSWADRFAQFMR